MEKYSSVQVPTGCRGHSFIRVSGPAWGGIDRNKVNYIAESRIEWLARLTVEYSPAQRRQVATSTT
jgi:hypothetical protein